MDSRPSVQRHPKLILQPREVASLLVVLLFTAAVLVHFVPRSWWPPDEGAYAHVASRLLQGDVLNRDVQDLHAGYVNLANALSLSLFGDDLLSLRYPIAALILLSAGLVWAAVRETDRWNAVLAGLAFASLSFVLFLNPSAHWYCLAIVVALISLLRSKRLFQPGALLLTGFLLATLFLFRQLTAVFVGAATLAYLFHAWPGSAQRVRSTVARAIIAVICAALLFYLGSKVGLATSLLFASAPLALLMLLFVRMRIADGAALRLVALVGLGFTIGIVPLLAYHAWTHSLADWFRDSFLVSFALTELDFFDQARFHALLLDALYQLVAPTGAADWLNGAFLVILLLAPLACGLVVVSRMLLSSQPAPVHPLPFVALFYSLVAVHYQIPIYLYYASGLSIPALLFVMHAKSVPRRAIATALTLVVCAVALLHHAGRSPAPPAQRFGHDQDRFVACDLPRCSLRIERDQQAIYRRLVDVIDEYSTPGDTILAVPLNPELYYLGGRRNAFPFYNTAFGLASRNDLSAALEKIDARPPRLVFHRPDDKYNTGNSRALMDHVRRYYRPLEAIAGFEIYVSAGGAGSD